MKKSTSFFLVSCAFYIACILGFVSGGSRTLSTVWLCLGFAFLALGVRQQKTEKDSDDDRKDS